MHLNSCFSSMLTLFTKYLLGFHIIVCFDGSTTHFQFDRYSLCVLKSFVYFLLVVVAAAVVVVVLLVRFLGVLFLHVCNSV